MVNNKILATLMHFNINMDLLQNICINSQQKRINIRNHTIGY